MDLNVSVLANVKPLRDLNVDKDPILALACGHTTTAKTLERESLKSNNLRDHQGKYVCCPVCPKSAVNSVRYERQIKHDQFEQHLRDEQVALSKEMARVQNDFYASCDSLEETKNRLLGLILKNGALPRMDPPDVKKRRLGKRAALHLSDVELISKTYGIPISQERAWRQLIKPLMLYIQQLTSVQDKALQSSTKKLFDTAVARLRHGGAGATRSKKQQAIPAEVTPGNSRDKILKTLVTRGFPRDGYIGSVFIDSLQERTNILFIILSLAFDALEVADATSGWYWFVEDLIACVLSHVMMLKNFALEGHYKNRVIQARLMSLGLIHKKTQWIEMRHTTEDWNAKWLQALMELERHEVKERKAIAREYRRYVKARHTESTDPLRDAQDYPEDDMEDDLDGSIVPGSGSTDPLSDAREIIEDGSVDWTLEVARLFRPIGKDTKGSNHRLLCKNGHSHVVDLREAGWRCNECQEGACAPRHV
ncbi:hypothetical protein BGX31_000012 [Mortierella sp. GBA43]|nr:hypothetical protein BGX31_000012 [Mortierella sp. GBA43]